MTQDLPGAAAAQPPFSRDGFLWSHRAVTVTVTVPLVTESARVP